MNDYPFDSSNSIYDSYEIRFTNLLGWCKHVQTLLHQGLVEEAREILAQAIADAEQPFIKKNTFL